MTFLDDALERAVDAIWEDKHTWGPPQRDLVEAARAELKAALLDVVRAVMAEEAQK